MKVNNDIWSKIYSIITQKEHSDIELNMVMRRWGEILMQPTVEVHVRDEIYRNLKTQIWCFKKEVNSGNERIISEVISVLRSYLKIPNKDMEQLIEYANKGGKIEMYDKIFISHSSKDEEYVVALVNFLEDIGVPKDFIFCTSIEEYGVTLGEDFDKRIKELFINNKIFVLFVLSENYYASPACLNEMGAAWVLQKDYMTILLKGFEYKQIEGAINPKKIAIKVDAGKEKVKYRLKEFGNKVIEFFQLEKVEERRWERYVNSFLSTFYD